MAKFNSKDTFEYKGNFYFVAISTTGPICVRLPGEDSDGVEVDLEKQSVAFRKEFDAVVQGLMVEREIEETCEQAFSDRFLYPDAPDADNEVEAFPRDIWS